MSDQSPLHACIRRYPVPACLRGIIGGDAARVVSALGCVGVSEYYADFLVKWRASRGGDTQGGGTQAGHTQAGGTKAGRTKGSRTNKGGRTKRGSSKGGGSRGGTATAAHPSPPSAAAASASSAATTTSTSNTASATPSTTPGSMSLSSHDWRGVVTKDGRWEAFRTILIPMRKDHCIQT